VLNQPRVKVLLLDEHFWVDGTLIEAWASLKSFKPRDDSGEPPGSAGTLGRNAERDFQGEKRANQTHASTTDAQALLYRKSPGTGAHLCFMGHLLMENRHGLIVDARLSQANGTAERDTATAMVSDLRGRHRITLGADKGYGRSQLCRRAAGAEGDPACSAEHHSPPIGH